MPLSFLGLDLQQWRDIVMIAFMTVALLAFVVILIFSVIIGFLGMGIMKRVRSILKDNVQPTTASVRATAENIRGTVEYVSETAVKPVVKVYGAAAGARRFVGVVTRFAGRGKNNGK
jgi:hypothetical protein